MNLPKYFLLYRTAENKLAKTHNQNDPKRTSILLRKMPKLRTMFPERFDT